MPQLEFKVTGVEAANYGIVPLLHFKLEITNASETETIQRTLQQAPIQWQPTQRACHPAEKTQPGEPTGDEDPEDPH